VPLTCFIDFDHRGAIGNARSDALGYRDLGVAASGVTFFRTLGSSFGAAVFGTVYSNVLHNTLPDAVVASGLDPSVIATPKPCTRCRRH